MSKTGELASVISEMRNAALAMNEAVDWLEDRFKGTSAEPEAAPAAPPLEMEAVRAVLADKSRAGHTAEVRALLQKYGADKLSGVDPVNYAALLADAEEL